MADLKIFRLLFLKFFFFLIVDICCVHGIHPLEEDEYKVLMQLAKERTRIKKKAVVKLWRWKED